MTAPERFQILREGRTLRVVDCFLDLKHPEAGVSVCFIGGDAEADEPKARAAFVVAALNVFGVSA